MTLPLGYLGMPEACGERAGHCRCALSRGHEPGFPHRCGHPECPGQWWGHWMQGGGRFEPVELPIKHEEAA